VDTEPVGQHGTKARTAGVIARPPLLFLGALLLGLISDHLLPLPISVSRAGSIHWIGAIVSACLIAIGVMLVAAGIRNFSEAGTPVPTNEPTRTLVTTGVHSWTRNPIYLGFFSCTSASASSCTVRGSSF
jgi:protein-S-isoprenylcysteine O-methyltransferase Ste14